jgi:hypothetical protein
MERGALRTADRTAPPAWTCLAVSALVLTGCSTPTTAGAQGDGQAQLKAAAQAARAYQQASVDGDYEAVCRASTEGMRQHVGRKDVAECAKFIAVPYRHRINPDARVSTADAVEVEPHGRHPAGIGVRVTTEAGLAPHQMALRLVQDEQGVWLVDQNVYLEESTGTKAVRAALSRG